MYIYTKELFGDNRYIVPFYLFKFLKSKPIREEEIIIKTASHVCHDKWRGVCWANDSGSRR